MFGKFGRAPEKANTTMVMSVEKAARIASLDENIANLVNTYQAALMDTIADDRNILTNAAAEMRTALKEKGISLEVPSDGGDSDVKDFVESFVAARAQNTGRREGF